jgi:hypothetical protein
VAPPALPATVPAPPAPAPPRPTVPPAVRLKERVQAICGPAYVVRVTPGQAKNALNLEITGLKAGEDERLMGRVVPVLESPEFGGLAIHLEILTPAK